MKATSESKRAAVARHCGDEPACNCKRETPTRLPRSKTLAKDSRVREREDYAPGARSRPVPDISIRWPSPSSPRVDAPTPCLWLGARAGAGAAPRRAARLGPRPRVRAAGHGRPGGRARRPRAAAASPAARCLPPRPAAGSARAVAGWRRRSHCRRRCGGARPRSRPRAAEAARTRRGAHSRRTRWPSASAACCASARVGLRRRVLQLRRGVVGDAAAAERPRRRRPLPSGGARRQAPPPPLRAAGEFLGRQSRRRKESNIEVAPYLLQLGSFVLDARSAPQRRSYARALAAFVAGSDAPRRSPSSALAPPPLRPPSGRRTASPSARPPARRRRREPRARLRSDPELAVRRPCALAVRPLARGGGGGGGALAALSPADAAAAGERAGWRRRRVVVGGRRRAAARRRATPPSARAGR